MNDLSVKIIGMIEEIQPYVDFDDNMDLFEGDVLDSLSVLVLVQELEEEYSIVIQAEEITKDNFGTVKNIVGFISQKL